MASFGVLCVLKGSNAGKYCVTVHKVYDYKNKIDEEHRIKITEQRNDFSILSIFTYTQNQENKENWLSV